MSGKTVFGVQIIEEDTGILEGNITRLWSPSLKKKKEYIFLSLVYWSR